MCKNNTRRRLILVFWFCIYHLPDRAHSRKCSQKGFIAGQFLKVHFCASNCCAVQALLKQLCERDSITFSSIQKCGKWRSNRSLITLSAFLWGSPVICLYSFCNINQPPFWKCGGAVLCTNWQNQILLQEKLCK